MELKTPLYDAHVNLKGKMVPFAGYLLPVQYETGVIREHLAVRNQAGLFDVSHMGEVKLTGKDALANIQNLVTNDCSKMYDGQVKYSPMCNEKGGVVDDLLIYKEGQEEYLIVVNASNRSKDVEWMRTHLFGDVVLTDISDSVAQIALQGPMAFTILKTVVKEDFIPKKYYSFNKDCNVSGINCLISRTGYTGSDGYELYCNSIDAAQLWDLLLAKGTESGLIPCGLGARDTLRLEAAMPLYGHEMDDDITPLEVDLSFAVKLEGKGDFIGRQAMIDKGPIERKRVGLNVTGRGIVREHCEVYLADRCIGHTTSGTFCPFIEKAVAMALLELDYTAIGTKVEVDVRGRRIEAEVVQLPFYKLERK